MSVSAKVNILSSDVTFEAPEAESLLAVLQANGYPIATSCGGVASCGLCRLTVVRGSESLTPIKPQELVHLGNVAKVVGLRLACQSKVCGPGPIVLQVPEVEIVEDRKRRKAERLRSDEHALPPSSKRAPRHEGGEGPRSQRFEPPRAERIEWRPRVLDRVERVERVEHDDKRREG